MKDGLEIKTFEYNSEEYQNELKLRNECLRIPLGMSLFDEDLSRDKKDIHIGAYIDNKMIGTLSLRN